MSNNVIGDLENKVLTQYNMRNYVVQTNNANPYAGTEYTVHPSGGLGSILSVKGGLFYGSSTSQPFLNVWIKSVKMKIRIENLDSFGKTIAIMPVANGSRGALGSNYSKSLSTFSKSVFTCELSKAGVTGSVKTITLIITPFKVEGYNSFESYMAAGYYSTLAVVGSDYTNFYVQQIDAAYSNNIASGCVFTTDSQFILHGAQTNLKVTV